MSSDEPKKAVGWFGWATFGFANYDQLDIIKCFVCRNSFAARFPKTGDSVTCSHCGAEGHGTYDEGGNYMLEWYESDTWS